MTKEDKEKLRQEIREYLDKKAEEEGIEYNRFGLRKWSNYPLMQRISVIVSIISLIVALIAHILR